jgi:outer membrane receptor for ferrienterochelin and colicins
VIVSGGLRVDRFSHVGVSLNPRLALILKPRERTAFKVLYGTAFRAPNAYELYYYGDATGRLGPERIRTAEVTWEQHLTGATRLTGSVFHYRINDLISQIEDATNPDGIAYANVGGATASGAEAEVERSWRRVQAGASYSFTHAVAAGTAERLPNSPRHLVHGRASTALLGGRIVLGGEWFAASARQGITGASAPSYGLARLSVSSGELAHGLRLRVNVDNFFDQPYVDPGAEEHRGAILQDGRTARATLAWRF